jgi:hypothetical protein
MAKKAVLYVCATDETRGAPLLRPVAIKLCGGARFVEYFLGDDLTEDRFACTGRFPADVDGCIAFPAQFDVIALEFCGSPEWFMRENPSAAADAYAMLRAHGYFVLTASGHGDIPRFALPGFDAKPDIPFTFQREGYMDEPRSERAPARRGTCLVFQKQ